jgi:hypothetical protein
LILSKRKKKEEKKSMILYLLIGFIGFFIGIFLSIYVYWILSQRQSLPQFSESEIERELFIAQLLNKKDQSFIKDQSFSNSEFINLL